MMCQPADFYPRSPCGERRYSLRHSTPNRRFLSTLSLRRATTVMVGLLMFNLYFYPRSPCGERRFTGRTELTAGYYFYPRSPCGERQNPNARCSAQSKFLSTLSLRRATIRLTARVVRLTFLSTLSLRRATSGRSLFLLHSCNFYPRSPCGERP